MKNEIATQIEHLIQGKSRKPGENAELRINWCTVLRRCTLYSDGTQCDILKSVIQFSADNSVIFENEIKSRDADGIIAELGGNISHAFCYEAVKLAKDLTR